MSHDTASPSPTVPTARAALASLKEALDHHFVAVERRSGELDPAVQQAYDALREAAEAYDDALFDAYEEVTPFDFSEPSPEENGGDAEPGEEPRVITAVTRHDWVIADPDTLIAAAQALPPGQLPGITAEGATPSVRAAVALIVDAYGVDDVDAATEGFGLEPAESTVWVLEGSPAEAGTWLEAPFRNIEGGRLIYRIDITTE